MNSVTSIDTILDIIMRIKNLKKEYATNFFLDVPKSELWIKLNLVMCEMIGETAFICRKNQGFYNLFYITTDLQVLRRDIDIFYKKYLNEIFVVDVIGRQGDIENIKPSFDQTGFYQYTTLVRMSKVHSESDTSQIDSKFIFYSDSQMSHPIYELLHKNFDPYAEQLPLIEEIDAWTKDSSILIFSNDKKTIQGFLIFELKGQTSYLRYWFVHPDYREMKIGSALLHKFFNESSDTKRQLFWVINSNENAIKRYQHYGFTKEGLVDCILINKNICYEG